MRERSILFIGDVVGQHSLATLITELPALVSRTQATCVIVNGENIVDGKGLTHNEAQALFAAGVHCITTGNHVWENWKSRPLLASEPRVLRPLNYPLENPGRGFGVFTLADGSSVGVIQIQGRAFMQPIDCPFKALDAAILKIKPRTNIIVVDVHAEATAEKRALGWHADGRVSAMLGTHTHVQTADACILPKGTAYITDVGMTGPYDSAIGMNSETAIKRFMLQTAHKYELATSDIRICGVHIGVDEQSGTAVRINPFVFPEFKRER
jgi:2',3'-cyclic-nucleotide 2'-phosphodiesterase